MQLQEYLQDLNARMSVSKTSGLWSEADKIRWINKAVVRSCNFAKWNFLNHHSTQLTEKDRESYFLPFDRKPGGFVFMKVDGNEHAKTSIENYQSKNYPWERIFCIIGDQFLVTPIPTEDGKIIDTYYRRRPVPMVNMTDESIVPEEFDEPVVKFALAVCLKKTPSRGSDADKEIMEATALLQQTKDREDEEEGTAGFLGQATSIRFIYKNRNE